MRLDREMAEEERPPVTPIAVKVGTAYDYSLLAVVNIYSRSAGQAWYKAVQGKPGQPGLGNLQCFLGT